MRYAVVNSRLVVANPTGKTVGWVEKTGEGKATFFMLETLEIPVRTFSEVVGRLKGLKELNLCPARIGS